MPIMTSRLRPPQTRSTDVQRTSLIPTLDHAVSAHACVILSAPAGSGKTTTLAQWSRSTTMSVAWLQLTEDINHTQTFTAYLFASLESYLPVHVLTALQSHGDHLNSLAIHLSELLEGTQAPFVLVLDDYHVIDNDLIYTFIHALIDNLPPHAHLIISTRIDPPLPLAVMRAKRTLVEFRLDALRFSNSEAASFLAQGMSHTLDDAQVQRLTDKVEGWATGLQLAALSLQRQMDISEFIDTFTGTHRHVFDYLLDEVIARQSTDLQQFMLMTAILEELCSELAQAVTGMDGAPILRYLDDNNLFIVALDEQRTWYRYHHLFRDVLLHQLHRQQSDNLPELHRRAAIWYRENDLPEQALTHSVAANDYALAAEIGQAIADGRKRTVRWYTDGIFCESYWST